MNEYQYETVIVEPNLEIIKRTDADGNEAWIPSDPANSDYQQFLVWLEAQTHKTTSKATAE